MAKLKILKARAGKMVRGRFVPYSKKQRRSNVAEGFRDAQGVFHPIRSASDYDSSRGDPPRKGARKKKAPRKKAKASRRPARKAVKKKAAARKRKR